MIKAAWRNLLVAGLISLLYIVLWDLNLWVNPNSICELIAKYIASPEPSSGKLDNGRAIWVKKWNVIKAKKIRFPKMCNLMSLL